MYCVQIIIFWFLFLHSLSFGKLVCACIQKSKVQIWGSSWFQFQFQSLSINNNKMVCTLLWMKYIVFKWNKIEFGTLENMWRIDTLQTSQRNKNDYFQLATTHNHYHPEAWHLNSLSLYIIQFFKFIDGEIINTHSMLNVTRGVSQGVWPCHLH
jgi:hypothetical protein